MSGVLYGVGVGPGDPSLLTLKAVETIKAADIVAVPDTGGEKTALNIVAEFIAGKELLCCPMPMTRDADVLEKCHEETADKICENLSSGRSIAFVTLGDPSIYSTYIYIHKKVLKKGFAAVMIPGVPSFCAAAAALGVSLCEADEPLHILPASGGDVRDALTLSGGKVLMKSGRTISTVYQTIEEMGLSDNAMMAECCSMENERLYRNLRDAGEKASYFSIIIVKDHE